MRVMLAVLAMLTLASASFAAEVDRESLRNQVRLPKLVLDPKFHYGDAGFYLGSDPAVEKVRPDSLMQVVLKAIQGLVENAVRSETDPQTLARWLTHLNERLKADPFDVRTRHMAAYVLACSGRGDEAARELATVALLQPGNMEVWTPLIALQHNRAVRVLVPQKELMKFNPMDDWDEPLRRFPSASADELRQIIRLLDECVVSCDAILGMTAADSMYGIRLWRAEARAVAKLARVHLDQREGNAVKTSPPIPERMLLEVMAECGREAVRAHPDNPLAVGGLTFSLMSVAMFNSSTSRQNHLFEGAFNEVATSEQREALSAALERLQALSNSKDQHVADDACEVLGLVYVRLEQWQEAVPYLERVMKSDPRRETAFDCLCVAFTMLDRYSDIDELCKARLAVEDEPRVRIILARHLANNAQLEEAVELLASTIDQYPTNYDLPCNLAAFYLRSNTPEHLDLADKYLEIAASRMTPSTSKGDQCYVRTMQAIQVAMTGDVDAARRRLKAVLAFEEGYEYAGSVLAMIGDEN